jgi:2-aminoethylphosphonate-pyruvate transaminase
MDGQRPYRLLTPGPLSTTRTVKEAMLTDVSTWDVDYNAIVQRVRSRLVELAVPDPASRADYTAVLMQGSGTFVVEALVGSALPPDGKLLVVDNGAYGARIHTIAQRLKIETAHLELGELEDVEPAAVDAALAADPGITHAALVHCETTTGRLNPAEEVSEVCHSRGVTLLLDAMSSFGGVPFDQVRSRVPFLVSSANKCIQGVPGFGFVVAERSALEACAGRARSLALDLFDQWRGMEAGGGKWRYTSPTHVLLAFDRALEELAQEGGIEARHARYRENHARTVQGFAALGLEPLLPAPARSPIITAFHMPERFTFSELYGALKARGFLIYPGKVTDADTFRIGHIGDLHVQDIDELVTAFETTLGEHA